MYINPVPILWLWQLRFLRFPKLIPDHASFVKEIAATDPPEHLNSLLNVLQARGMASNTSQGFLLWLLPCCPPPLVHTWIGGLLLFFFSYFFPLAQCQIDSFRHSLSVGFKQQSYLISYFILVPVANSSFASDCASACLQFHNRNHAV